VSATDQAKANSPSTAGSESESPRICWPAARDRADQDLRPGAAHVQVLHRGRGGGARDRLHHRAAV